MLVRIIGCSIGVGFAVWVVLQFVGQYFGVPTDRIDMISTDTAFMETSGAMMYQAFAVLGRADPPT